MRTLFLFSLSLLLLGCQSSGEPAAPAPGVFRHIKVSSGARIELGQPLPESLGAQEQVDGSYLLAQGAFRGADSIRVFVTTNGRVAGMRFDYARGTDAAAEIADYTETLGEPSEVEGAATWDDGTTVFQYARVKPPHALLYDTALWPNRIGG